MAVRKARSGPAPTQPAPIAALASALDLDPHAVVATVETFNRAVVDGGTFDPSRLDDCHTSSLTPEKTHWAQRLDRPLYYGIAMRPGITFTYMGVAVRSDARVVRTDGTTFDNVFAAGEIMSGNILRRLHGMVAYGFGLCLVSTVSTGIMQDFLGIDPPYALVSVPVLSGLVGGIGLAAGCVGLLVLKARSSDVTSFAQMTIKDYGFLVSLLFLALTGLATLFTRTTPAYGLVLIVHLAAIGLTFAAAPYSKFVHLIYRFLALVRDNLERATA